MGECVHTCTCSHRIVTLNITLLYHHVGVTCESCDCCMQPLLVHTTQFCMHILTKLPHVPPPPPLQLTSGALYPAVPIVTCFFWYFCGSLFREVRSTEESKSVRATLKDCRGVQQHKRGEEQRQLADRPMRTLLAVCGEEQRRLADMECLLLIHVCKVTSAHLQEHTSIKLNAKRTNMHAYQHTGTQVRIYLKKCGKNHTGS